VLRVVIGSALYLTLCGLFAFAAAAILRNTAATITAMIGLLFVLPVLVNLTPWRNDLVRWLPSSAARAISATVWNAGPQNSHLFFPWGQFAVFAACTAVQGDPDEAQRRADAIDHWQYGDAARAADPAAEAWAALARALLCSRGVKQMRADADEAARRFAALGIVAPGATLLQGAGAVLCGDLDRGEAFFADAASGGEEVGDFETRARALAEQALVAMARGDWGRAEVLAGQAGTALPRAGMEGPLVCAVQARVAVHRGDTARARQQLLSAQRLRPLMTYAQPQFTVQALVELTRVHLALADLAGARTLAREIDEVLKRQPDLGTLTGEIQALRTQLGTDRRSASPGASALTAAELRLLPLLATHLTLSEIAAEMFLSPYTIRSQAYSLYRKLGVASRGRAIARSRELGLLEG
jgi:LuxR family transcriptional regulator, maltose regulon positive regulatory protein